MIRRISGNLAILCVGFAGMLADSTVSADSQPAATRPTAHSKPGTRLVGIEKRTPWTTSRVTGSPEPPLPYDIERVFAQITFVHPVDITCAPGIDRLFVVEQGGKIYSFRNQPDVAKPDLAIDLAQQFPGVRETYALAFHPKFSENRFCYVCSIRDPERPDGTRISRFTVTAADPPTIDPKSEKIVITWLSGGHNGCCLKFGLDGCLYISTGDGAGPNPPDPRRTGQDISDLLSSILRIDVDHAEAGRNYRIPPDNPFVSRRGARPEVWAYGLRNPWRMSVDRQTGDLWVGDVGWELWELLYRIERGGNYGWSVVEGRQPTNPEWPRGPTPILPPVIDHPHSEAASITDGATYYGSRLPELRGVHLYGDYVTGKIWGLRWQNGKILRQRELANTALKIVGFGEDNRGELYLLDHSGGTVNRLIRNRAHGQQAAFPRSLSETGLFASVADQKPAPGVLAYSINAEPWEDGAVAERFVGIPGSAQIATAATAATAWQFPKDAVLAKTLSLETRAGQTTRRRRIETQLLHYNGSDWRAYTYRWNAEQTDAALVGAAGEDCPLPDAAQSPAGRQAKRTWHFASRAECLRCHNPWAGSALGFHTAQLNKEHDYADGPASQLDTVFHIGLCQPPVAVEKRPRLANPHDTTADLTERARAYLHTNCAHCHRINAGSAVLSQMQYDIPLKEASLIGARPSQGSFGIYAAQVVAPGDPCRSVVLYRMSKVGSGRMPHIGSQVVDPRGVALIHRWIKKLPVDSKGAKEDETAKKMRTREHGLLKELETAKTAPAAARVTLADRLLSTTSGALMLLMAIDEGLLTKETVTLAVQRGTTHEAMAVRDLFERFVPEEKRTKRMGSVMRPADILHLRGNADHGRRVFFDTAGVQCKNCHRIDKMGRELGPDLDHIGKKYGPAKILENILDPSKEIDPKFVPYLVETSDGRIHTGLLVRKDAKEIVLKDAQGTLIRIPSDRIERMAGQNKSLMPELLLRDLTPEQVADLLAYLSSLR